MSPKRILSHWLWGCNVENYLESQECLDLVYCALPSLTAGAKAANYCKRNNVKFVVDVQDIWPEAFCMIVKNKILQLAFKPMEWLVNKSYSQADLVVAVSDTYRDRGLSVNKNDNKGLTVYLGNNLSLFDESKNEYKIKRCDSEFWLAYIGTLGYSYDLPCVIDAIAKYTLNNLNAKKVKLIAMGSGPLLDQFKSYAVSKKVNASFLGRVPYSEMVGTMCSCDAVVNPIRKGAAQSITNKVGDYAFSGLAVINTQECIEYRELVDDYHCGINCECGNSDQVADAIKRLATNSDLCKQMGEGSRKLGEERFDRNNTYPLIVRALEELVK